MMILLTGGSACGKSAYAEELCCRSPLPRYYLAAMKPYGREGGRKIKRHRALRAGKGFETIERYPDYENLRLPRRGAALLECIANLTANEMFDDDGKMSDPCPRVLAGVKALNGQCDLLVVVTNDVGSDIRVYEEGTAAYIRALGRINAALAAMADAVIEMAAGIPLPIKMPREDIFPRELLPRIRSRRERPHEDRLPLTASLETAFPQAAAEPDFSVSSSGTASSAAAAEPDFSVSSSGTASSAAAAEPDPAGDTHNVHHADFREANKMILILGGEGSGKRTFARSLGYTDAEMTRNPDSPLPVFFQLEQVLLEDPSLADSLPEKLLRKELVLCCEVGSGIIPLSEKERLAREAIGRACVLLAREADAVVRLVAGIPMAIKGELPRRSSSIGR